MTSHASVEEKFPENPLAAFTRVTDERTDEELMTDFMAGDSAAGGELFNRYRFSLGKFIGSQIPRAVDAQEVFASTWLRVVEAKTRSSYRPSGAFKAWIYTIADNLIKDFYRKARRTAETDAIDVLDVETALPNPGPGPDDESRFDVRRYLRCLDQLSEVQREAHKRRAFGFTYEEIVRDTDSNIETVKKRLGVASRKIRDCMGLPRGPNVDGTRQ